MEHKTLIAKQKRQNEQEMDELCVHDCDFNREIKKSTKNYQNYRSGSALCIESLY